MKLIYCWNILVKFKININETPMSRSFTVRWAAKKLLFDLKLLSSCAAMTRLLLFYHIFAIIIFFKNFFNKFIDCIFSSVKSNWFTKFIINTYNFVSKTVKIMFVIFFSIWSIITSIISLQFFKPDSKSAWIFNGTVECLK